MKKTILFAALLVAATFSAYSHDDCEPINSPDKKPLTIMVETPGTLSQQLADYYKTEITKLTVIGRLNGSDMSMLNNLPNLAVLDMEYVNLEELPACAFQGKTSLTSVKLPLTVKTIRYSAFQKCSNLKSVTIPNSVTEIEDYAFDGCCNLTSVTIGNSVEEIGFCAFRDCSSLTSITIPSSVTSIGAWAFCRCRSLRTVRCKAKTRPSVYAGAFDDVHAMSTLYVPMGSKVAYAAVNECSNLKIIEIEF